jgi:L-threonylcarbamoyladenylate synthase
MEADSKIIRLTDGVPTGSAGLQRAVEVLRRGGVIVFPTETFYGLGANALLENALERVMTIKGRAATIPLLSLVDCMERVKQLARSIPPWSLKLIERFWPGPLTLVFPAREDLPQALVGPSGGVAVRFSPHPTARELVRGMDAPLVGTSANLHGEPAVCRVDDLSDEVKGAVDLVLDAGETHGGLPSTVLDCTSFPPRLLRSGRIKRELIEEALGVGIEEGR